MRVLVVEDEISILEQISNLLNDAGFVVNQARNGEEGEYFALEFDHDLAIIDLGLPQKDGMTLIRHLRDKDITCPILILTARDSWKDKVLGLEVGADDYLVKPFHPEELKARINALIRRSTGHASAKLHFGPLVLDSAAKRVFVHDKEIELTSYEYNTLEYLVFKEGSAISKTELTEHLYHQDFERDSNVIEVFIGRLRRKLQPLDPIKTVRGQGYRFDSENL